jgi:hypothetical protein
MAARTSKQPKARKKARPPLDGAGWILLEKGHDIISEHLTGTKLSPIAGVPLVQRLRNETVPSMRESLVDPGVCEELDGAYWDDLRIEVEGNSIRYLPSLPIRRLRDFRDINACRHYLWEPAIHRYWHSSSAYRGSAQQRRSRNSLLSQFPGRQRRPPDSALDKSRASKRTPAVSDIKDEQATLKQPRASSLKRAMSSGSDAARPERKRRKGGGMRQLLSDSKIEEGQRFYRGMLAEDLTWTKRQAAAERVKEKLKLLVSWRTVQRHIIDPVLKNGR